MQISAAIVRLFFTISSAVNLGLFSFKAIAAEVYLTAIYRLHYFYSFSKYLKLLSYSL